MLSSPQKLTQRELDEMYRPENVQVSRPMLFWLRHERKARSRMKTYQCLLLLVRMGVSQFAVRVLNLLDLRHYLPGDSPGWCAVLWICAHCLQEANSLRLPARV